MYVDVVAEFRKDGCLVPLFFVWEDGRKYSIDRILKIERCASRKAGGVGVMYTCMIKGQESHLFYEVDKWFMERKQNDTKSSRQSLQVDLIMMLSSRKENAKMKDKLSFDF